jgi:hypothetical protein
VLVKLLISISGTRNGQEWPPRYSVMDLPDAEAMDYCQAGYAIPVTTFRDDIETAVMPVEEQRIGPRPGLTTRNGPVKKTRKEEHDADSTHVGHERHP